MEPTAEPDDRRGGCGFLALVVAAPLLVIGALVAMLFIRSGANSEPPPWSQMEEAAASFPMPDGYRPGDMRRYGERCNGKLLTCNWAMVTSAPIRERAAPMSCDELAEALDSWHATAGFEPTQSFNREDGGCSQLGNIDGYGVAVHLSRHEFFIQVTLME